MGNEVVVTDGSEKQVLKLIKFVPSIFALCLGIVLSFSIYIEHKNILQLQSAKISKEFVQRNKIEIKNQVNFVNSFIKNSKENFTNRLKDKLYFDVLYTDSFVNKIYSDHKGKSKNEIIKIITNKIANLKITNNIITISKNKELEKIKNTFFKDNIINTTLISYTKKVEALDIYITTSLRIKDFEDILKKELIREIKKFDFGKDRYIFLIDYESNVLVHIDKNLEGKNIFKDTYIKKRKDEIKKLINIAKNGNGYLTYSQFQKPSTQEFVDKTSYIIGFNDWSWFIGTGFYHDDIIRAIKKESDELNKIFAQYQQNAIIGTIIFTLSMIILSIYFSKLVQSKFSSYKKDIFETNKKNELYNNLLAQQSKMAAIGEMIGNIAHQWRQPLTVISMSANNMQVDVELGDVNDKNTLEYTHDILFQTNYLSNTIDDFRNFFQSDEQKSNFIIKEAYTHTLKLIKAQFKNHQIELIENIEDATVNGVFNEFMQVIINIFNNCKDAYIETKIKENRVIFIDTTLDENYVYLRIKDAAGGVNDEILEKVFEPYFTTKHQSRGTGIGLYMSKEIIDKHMNGLLSIQNTEFEYNNQTFKGTLLTIKIPLVKEV